MRAERAGCTSWRALRALVIAAGAACGLCGCAGGGADAVGVESEGSANGAVSRGERDGPGLAQLARAEAGAPNEQAKRAAPPPPLTAADIGLIPVEERAPGSAAARTLADVIASISSFAPEERADSGPPDEESLRLYGRAKLAAQAGDSAGAAALLESAVRLDAERPELWRELGIAQVGAGRRTAGIASLRKALSLGDDSDSTRIVVAREELRAGRTAEAAAMLAPVFLERPEREAGILRGIAALPMGEAMLAMGHTLAAAECFALAASSAADQLAASPMRQEAGEVLRRRAELGVRAGDLFMRLDRPEEANRAYASSAVLPGVDGEQMGPRLVASLTRMGRPATAALSIVETVRAREGRIEPWQIEAAAYLSRFEGIGAAMSRELAGLMDLPEVKASATQRGRLARAAFQAGAIAGEAPVAMLMAHVREVPRDEEATALLLLDAADGGARGGVSARVKELVSASPYHAETVAAALMDTGLFRAFVAEKPARSAEAALVRVMVLGRAGRAKEALKEMRERAWPAELAAAAAVTQIECGREAADAEAVRGGLEKLRTLANDSGAMGQVWLTRGLGKAGERDGPREAALRAVDAAAPGSAERQEAVRAAIALMEAADWARVEELLRELARADAMDEMPYEGLLGLFAPNGAKPDEAKFSEALRELRRISPNGRLLRVLQARELAGRRQFGAVLNVVAPLLTPGVDSPPVLSLVSLAIEGAAASGESAAVERGLALLKQQSQGRRGSPALVESMARALGAGGRAEEGLALLEDELREWPIAGLARTRERLLRERLGRGEEADALARARLEAAPRTAEHVIEHAEFLASRGESADAAKVLADGMPAGAPLSRQDGVRLVQLLEKVLPKEEEKVGAEQAAGLVRVLDIVVERGAPVPPQMFVRRLDLLVAADPADTQRLLGAAEDVGERFPQLALPAYGRAIEKLMEVKPARHALRFLGATAMKLDPPNEAALVQWVDLTTREGDAQDGVWLIDTLTETTRLDMMLSRLGAELALETALEKRAEFGYYVALLYGTRGREEESHAIYRHVLSFMPRHAWTANNLGYAILEEEGPTPEADRLITIAYEEKPFEANIVDSLGWLRYRMGRFEDAQGEGTAASKAGALSLLNRAAELPEGQQDGHILDHYGDVLWRVGNKDEAKRMWRQAERWVLMEIAAMEARGNDAPAARLARERALVGVIRGKIKAADEGGEPAVALTAAEAAKAGGQDGE